MSYRYVKDIYKYINHTIVFLNASICIYLKYIIIRIYVKNIYYYLFILIQFIMLLVINVSCNVKYLDKPDLFICVFFILIILHILYF